MPSPISPDPIEITVDDLLKNQKAAKSHRSDVSDSAAQAIEIGQKCVEPLVWKSIIPVKNLCGNSIYFDNNFELQNQFLAEKLSGSSAAAFVIGTLGHPLDDEIRRTMKNDPILGYLLDMFGSKYSERLANWAQKQIRDQADQTSLPTSMAFFPGNAYWSLTEGQQQIFAMLSPDPQFVTLTDSCLILPQKSFSFIMGLGCPQENTSPCETCSKRENCVMRQ